MAEKVENTSGLALPNARKVAPATSASKRRMLDIVARLGMKNSEAVIPRVEKRKRSQTISQMNLSGRRRVSVQK